MRELAMEERSPSSNDMLIDGSVTRDSFSNFRFWVPRFWFGPFHRGHWGPFAALRYRHKHRQAKIKRNL